MPAPKQVERARSQAALTCKAGLRHYVQQSLPYDRTNQRPSAPCQEFWAVCVFDPRILTSVHAAS